LKLATISNYFKPNIICASIEGTNLLEIFVTIVVCDNTLEGKTIGETWDNQGGMNAMFYLTFNMWHECCQDETHITS
jgi:hypothetical protein